VKKGCSDTTPISKEKPMRQRRPFFPDTQVHGDLKATARWLDNLTGNGQKSFDPPGIRRRAQPGLLPTLF